MLQLGKETKVPALGKEWTVGRLELRLVRAFKDWVKDRLDDPLALPERYFTLLPPEEQLARVKRAEQVNRDLRNFSIQCPLAQEFLRTEEGCAEFARLMLSQNHPDITADEAFLVFQEAGAAWGQAVSAAAGQAPEGNGAGPAAG